LKKILIISLIAVLSENMLFAQESYTTTGLTDLVNYIAWNKTMDHGSPDISGSPYLNDEFIPGEIYFDGKYKVEKVPLRLNLYNGDLEFKEKNVIMAMADPNRVDKVVIGDYTLVYLKDEKAKVSGFVRMWNSNKPSIVTKMETDFLKKEPAKPYVEPKPDRFERALDKHYLLKGDNEIEKITSVKKLIQALGDHEKELSEFAKEQKISAGNVEELVKLVNYYHSLTPQ